MLKDENNKYYDTQYASDPMTAINAQTTMIQMPLDTFISNQKVL